MDEALRYAGEALAAVPGDPGMAENFVVSAIATGKLAEALPIVERQRAARPKDQRWITYRIDMDLRLWCSDACARTEAIGSVIFGHILLRDRSAPSGRHVIDFDPVTGRLTDTLTDGDRQVLRHGTCTREAFTGFPGLSA